MSVKQDKISARLAQLKSDLGDRVGASEIGDWRLAKYQEYVLAGKEPPFDFTAYHEEREKARAEIKELEGKLK